MLKLVSKNSIFLIAATTLIFAVILISFLLALRPVDAKIYGREVVFTVEKGASLSDIAAGLQQKGIIKSASAFKLYGLLSGSAHVFKPGRYKLFSSWSVVQIAGALVIGSPKIAVVITEGETLKDIDYKLSQTGVIKSGELLDFDWRTFKDDYQFLNEVNSLEGFLFPDTYLFSAYTSASTVIKSFLDNFQIKAWRGLLDEEKNFYQTLVVASLVEKEAPFSVDRPIIAGIIYKRLRLGMPLQVDAAVAYAKCDFRFLTCDAQTRRLLKTDLALDSRFNTYLNKGLPPIPIDNPGIDAMQAAINPKTSSYLYYISNPDTKKTIFAATLDEHNTNRVKYLIRK